MKIQPYTVNDLKEKLQQNSFWNTPVLPITRHRALSHIHNPRADRDDVVLFVAYDNDSIIGYFGVLPDKIYLHDVEYKIAWGSTIWVDPRLRGSTIGRSLLLAAFKHHDICSSGFTRSGKMVADASGKFSTLRESEGTAFIVRSCCSFLLPKQFPKLRRLRPALEVVDKIMNKFVDLRLFLWKKTKPRYQTDHIEFITELDEQTDHFIRQQSRKELSRRTAQELNWIIKFPWVLPAPRPDNTSARYFFSSISKRFLYLNVKVFDATDSMIGFIMFKVKDNTMNIPFAYFNKTAINDIASLIVFMMLEMKIDIFVTYHIDIMCKIREMNFPCLYKKDLSLLYYISNKLKDHDFSSCNFQDGEGDSVFT